MNLPAVPARPAQAASRQLLHTLWAVWDRLAIYLPLVLMGLLALLTYWMVRITPQLVEPEGPRTPVHEVDFFMRDAVMKTYDKDGRLQHQLFGTEMRHYADNATVEIDQARWWGQAPDGRITRASARQALSKDDGSEVQLMGDAVVVREALTQADGTALPRLEFQGEFLHIYADDERLKSHLPVLFFRGEDRFSADSFRYDHIERTADLQGRVKAQLQPSKPSAGAPGLGR